MHTVLTDITIGEAKDIVANSWKNPLETWRRLQKRPDSTAEGRKRNLLRAIVSPERCSLLELQVGMERWESAVSQYEDIIHGSFETAGLLRPQIYKDATGIVNDCRARWERASGTALADAVNNTVMTIVKSASLRCTFLRSRAQPR